MSASEKETLETPKKEEWYHPLLFKEVGGSITWTEWKELWDKSSGPILEQLLHLAFKEKVRCTLEEVLDRINFFFDVAFGYGDHDSSVVWVHPDYRESYWRAPGYHTASETEKERKRIAGVAWGILCQKVLKNTANEYQHLPSWLKLVVNVTVLPKAVWFFSYEKNFPSRFDEDKHDSIVAKDFIFSMCRLGWGSGDRGIVTQEVELLNGFRENFLYFLNKLNKLDWLSSVYYLLSEEDMEVLKKIALSDLPSFGSDPFSTIEEAAVSGGDVKAAARAYVLLRALREERKRENQLLSRAGRKLREAGERLVSLNEEKKELQQALKLKTVGINQSQISSRIKEIESELPRLNQEHKEAREEYERLEKLYPSFRR